MSERPKVVITDYDYGDVDIETAILKDAASEVARGLTGRAPNYPVNAVTPSGT